MAESFLSCIAFAGNDIGEDGWWDVAEALRPKLNPDGQLVQYRLDPATVFGGTPRASSLGCCAVVMSHDCF